MSSRYGRDGSEERNVGGQAPSNSPWKPFEERRRDRDAKRLAVLQTAAQLFIDEGFNKTKLSDVAERLNITKPALYHYFDSKEAILFECYRMGQELIEGHLTEIEVSPGSGLDKVRDFIRAYITKVMTVPFGMCLVRLDDRELSTAARKEVRARKRQVDRRVRALIEGGLDDGSIVSCDAKLATFAIAGALNWIGFWYDRGGPQEPVSIAEQFVLLLTDGLAVRPKPA
jgi:AcrR family transcriptional regulator